MARYIDADALIEAIKSELWDWQTLDDITATSVLKQTISDIQNAPTADVRENVHAHWEDWSFLGWDMETHWRRRCSNCLCEREDDNEEKDTLFCPNCGAQMGERRE